MKKITAFSLVAVIATASTAFAPTTDMSFEGSIKFSVTVEGATNPRAADMMKNSTLEIDIAQGKSKTIMTMAMGSTASINGLIADSIVTLSDFGGRKTAMKAPLNRTSGAKKASEIKYLDDTKQIAGYTCHKAEIKNDDGTVTELYYTDQLPVYEGKAGEYKGLKGFPLEFTTNGRGMTMHFTAISVTKGTLPGDTFTIPAGYTMQTTQSMQQNMQHGGMGMGGH